MSIQSLASDLANRVNSMAQDHPINNANVIEKLIEKEMVEHNALLLLCWMDKCARLKEALQLILDEPANEVLRDEARQLLGVRK